MIVHAVSLAALDKKGELNCVFVMHLKNETVSSRELALQYMGEGDASRFFAQLDRYTRKPPDRSFDAIQDI